MEIPDVSVPDIDAPAVTVLADVLADVPKTEVETPYLSLSKNSPKMPDVHANISPLSHDLPGIPGSLKTSLNGDIETPKINTSLDYPNANLNTPTIGEIDTPSLDFQTNIKKPQIDARMPKAKIPDIAVPEIEAPNVRMQNMEAPNVSLPSAKMPNLNIPDLKAPDIDTPKFKTPD